MAIINMNIPSIYNTPISNTFIENYMPYANPTYSCIYIYSLKECLSGNTKITTKDIAQKFNLLDSDVKNCWEYWSNKGIISLDSDSENNISINFIFPVPVPPEYNSTISEDNNLDIKKAPTYSPDELNLYMENSEEVSKLFKHAEKVLRKTLSYNELNTIFGFHEHFKMPLDVIEILLDYCGESNKTNMKYIESIAMEWIDNGIMTKKEAMFNKNSKSIMKILDRNYSNITTEEMKFIKKWLDELKMPINIVLEACEKAVIQLNRKPLNASRKPFPYIDKIICYWHENNVKSINDVKNLDSKYKKENEIKQEEKKLQNNKRAYKTTNKFVNYKQPQIDFKSLERANFEYLQEVLRGEK